MYLRPAEIGENEFRARRERLARAKDSTGAQEILEPGRGLQAQCPERQRDFVIGRLCLEVQIPAELPNGGLNIAAIAGARRR